MTLPARFPLRRCAGRLVGLLGMVAMLAGCLPGEPPPECWKSTEPHGTASSTAAQADAVPWWQFWGRRGQQSVSGDTAEETGTGAPPDEQSDPGKPTATELSRVVIGVDGSGSLLGHLQAEGNVWDRSLTALQLLIATQSAETVVVRVGGPEPQPVASLQTFADPCFFEGCGPFAPVSSNLTALWQQARPGQLTILVSDLETNAALTGKLVQAIDQSKPEAVGVVAVDAPFSGQLFNPFTGKGTVSIDNGKRPLYLLVTGPQEPVKTILREGAGAFGQVRLQPVFSSLLPVGTGATAYARELDLLDDDGQPDPRQGAVGGSVTVGSLKINPINNVLTVTVEPGQSRQLALSTQGFLDDARGAAYPPGQLVLERYNPEEERWQAGAQGVTVEALRLQNRNLSATLSLDAGLPAGLVRARLPAHRGVEAWWLEMSANGPDDEAKGRTKGLYGLLATLQASRQEPDAPPAAVLCFAHSPT